MRRFLCLVLLAACAGHAEKIKYPSSFRGPDVDNYHGTFVEDPYRWLEQPDSPETRAWITEQNRVTFGWLAGARTRGPIRARLDALYRYERRELPQRHGDFVFYKQNPGLLNQMVLWVENLDGTGARVLLDPNPLSADNTIALLDWVPSRDGRLLAYSLQTAGEDWVEWRVKDVVTGKDLPDKLQWSKFSTVAWTHDNAGFFYGRYPQPTGDKLTESTRFHKLYHHRVGAPQAEDRLIHETPAQPDWAFDPAISDDGKTLVVAVWRSTDPENLVYVMDLPDGRALRPLVGEWRGEYQFLGGSAGQLYFLTNVGAPRRRIVKLAEGTGESVIVPESDDYIEHARLVAGRLLVSRLHHVSSQLAVHGLDGANQGTVELPPLISLDGISGEPEHDEAFVMVESYVVPPRMLRVAPADRRASTWKADAPPFDPSRYETRQVFYRSKDGTRVPMFLTHKKGLALDGQNPTILYGYGGFSSSQAPYFSPTQIAWFERGGVLAVANIRGGAEYGEAWHKAGVRGLKQNVFDDFIAAAEYLIAERVTSRKRLAIRGGSNGGLLVAAVALQRPDLFAAVLVEVGVLDMLRYHKFTVGHLWAGEYGSADDPAAFKWLHRYSPLHNVRFGARYPAMLITTADHDDRVVPAHSYKFAAAVQTAQAGRAPILLRVQTRAGHGVGKPLGAKLDEDADKLGFLLRVMEAE